MADSPAVRLYVDDDMPEVLDVLKAALGEPPGLQRTPELFRWKHIDNPFGRSIMLVAELDGRIAGFRAFMRWRLSASDGTVVECGRAVDTSTHPDFQRRGVFRALTEAGVDRAAEEAIDLIFNTPNAKSGAGYLSMGWHEVGPVGVMVRPRLPLLWRKRGAWESTPSERFDAAALSAVLTRSARGLRTVRTPEYLAWRFSSHPTARYLVETRPDGAAVGRLSTRYGRRELVISEMGGPGGHRAARSLVHRHRPDYAVGWFSSDSAERSQAIRAGLVPVPRVAALTLVARPLTTLSVNTTSPENWDLSLGDLELL